MFVFKPIGALDRWPKNHAIALLTSSHSAHYRCRTRWRSGLHDAGVAHPNRERETWASKKRPLRGDLPDGGGQA